MFQRYSTIVVLLFLQSFLLFQCLSAEPAIRDYIDEADRIRLKSIVELATPLSSNDLSSIYYHVNVHTKLGTLPPDSSAICAHLQKATVGNNELQSIYFASLTAQLLGKCELDVSSMTTRLNSLVKEDASVAELYYIGLALSALGRPIDSVKFSKLLLGAVKRDESLLNMGLALQLASRFSRPEDREVFLEKIEDVLSHADEVGEKFLQFEGGLSVTSSIINGVYQIAQVSNKAVPLSTKQAMMFVNYFLSRKHVLTPKGVTDLLNSLVLFTNNNNHIPYVFTVYGQQALSKSSSILTIRISNLLGNHVGPLTVTGVSLTRKSGNPFAQNVNFKMVTGDNTLFAYDFALKASKIPAGHYTLFLKAIPYTADPRVFGNVGAEIDVNILTEVELVDGELTIIDSDVGNKVTKLNYPNSALEVFEVDYHQRLQLKFTLMDTQAKKTMEVHQAFLRFQNVETRQEIIFVAELDGSGYKVDINLLTRSQDFGHLSGLYLIELIVGDTFVSNPFSWKIGQIQLKFNRLQFDNDVTVKSIKEKYSPKPEIVHIFREQEKRPHPAISNFFTLLCAAPLLLLLGMWLYIGLNLKGFHLSISAIVFHLSLVSVFILYAAFFIKLNMFQTIKWLAGLGALVFLSGHSLLSDKIKKSNN